MPGKVLNAKEYLRSLPRLSEIPLVRQDQLQRLYEQFVRGIEEKELLDEVESRMVARAEIVLDLTKLGNEISPFSEDMPDHLLVSLRSGDKVDVSSFADDEKWKLGEWMRKNGLFYTDWGEDPLEKALDAIADARIGGDFKERMIALDMLIQVTHGAGRLSSMFIEGDDPDEFLDRLSGVANPSAPRTGTRRPAGVLVRAHLRKRKL